ncbi:MAG: FxLYD domain-containing protein [Chloroflexota bacterium]
MKKLAIWLVLGWLLSGCGQVVTPTPAAVVKTQPPPTARQAAATPAPPPTATPRPVTPAATPTPTVTPTPIIYAVQSGDTLLKIAIQFDRTVEAIQEANGIIDPRFLQIGQELVIPPPETDPAAPPTPTPTPPPLVIEALNFVETRPGALWGLGEVANPGDEYLTEVVVEAALFDGAGVLLARAAAYTQLDIVPPHQAVPFAILFDSPPGDFAQYQVAAVSGVPVSEQARYYFDLETFDLHGDPTGVSTYRLGGQLRNTGAADAESIRLVAVAYNAEDKVLAQRQAELAVSLLKAGAATTFEIDLIIPRGMVDHYRVLVQGLTAQ